MTTAIERLAPRHRPAPIGSVYCFRCDAADCEHARPPLSRAVFTSYGPTGQPSWADFAETLRLARDERVSSLFEDPPAILARFQFGRDVKAKMLRAFGKRSRRFALLAQLTAGYFGRSRDDRFAITVQIAESCAEAGRPEVLFNVVGSSPDGRAAMDVFAGDGPANFHAALSAARQRVAKIASQLSVSGGRADDDLRNRELSRVPGLLHDLGIALERGGRQRERRTRHSAERRVDNRPTAVALSDAWRARPDAIFRDEARDTLIVLGPRGRAHAFSPDGRHVTSLTLSGDERHSRVARGRWRPATPEERSALMALLPPKTSFPAKRSD